MEEENRKKSVREGNGKWKMTMGEGEGEGEGSNYPMKSC